MANDRETTRTIHRAEGVVVPPRGEQPIGVQRRDRVGGAWPRQGGVLGVLATVLALVAVAVAGLASVAYERFYEALGVDARDLGLDIGVIVRHAAGFIVAVALLLTLALMLVRGVADGLRWRLQASGQGWTLHSRDFAVLLGLYLAAGLLLAYAGYALTDRVLTYSTEATSAARSGYAVRPLQVLGLPLVATHAEPVAVLPVARARNVPGIWDLHDHQLLYLGQGRGGGVLYDATGRRAVYAPMNELVMYVSNCAAKAPVPACKAGLT
jgi:hypothetical protein